MADDWKAALPEDLKAEPMLKDIPDVPTLAKAFRDTKTLVGSSVRPPGANATPEEKAAFRATMLKLDPDLAVVAPEDRAPKAATDYAPPKDLPLPDAVLERVRADAAAEGLTQRQFQTRAKKVAEALAAETQSNSEARAALQKELGGAYDERIAAAAIAAEKLHYPPALIAAVKAGTVDLPTFKFLSDAAKGFQGSTELATQLGGLTTRHTPAELDYQMAEIRRNPEYFTSKALQARMLELAKERWPDRPNGAV